MKKAIKIIGIIIMGICTLIVVMALFTDDSKNNKTSTNTNTTTNNTTKNTNSETKKNQAPPMIENIDYTQYVSIEDMNIEVTEGTTRGKAYVTVKNNSNKTLNYVRVDIYFYDSAENVVGSTFTNSGNSFLPGATQTLNRSVTWESNYAAYRMVVTKVN